MSVRKSISFADDEDDLLQYFIDNGQSKIAKTALQFYKDNKDKIIPEYLVNLLTNIGSIQKPITQDIQNKMIKLRK
jgi:hypothetical protein